MSELAVTQPRRRGRKSVMTPDNARVICDCLAKGMPFTHACAVAGISFQSFNVWRDKSPDFASQVETSIARGIQKRLEKIERASETGDWRASAWLLEHCNPEHFSKSRIQVEAVGSLEHSFIIPQRTLNEIAQARARHDQKPIIEAIEASPA